MGLTENFIWKNNYCKRRISAYFPDKTPRGKKFESLLKTNFQMEVPFEVQGMKAPFETQEINRDYFQFCLLQFHNIPFETQEINRHYFMEVTDVNEKTIYVELEGDYIRIRPKGNNTTLCYLYSKYYKEYEYFGCKVYSGKKIVSVSFLEDGLWLNLEETPFHNLATILIELDKNQNFNIDEFIRHNWRGHESKLIDWFSSIERNPMAPFDVYINLIKLLNLKKDLNKCNWIYIFLEGSENSTMSSELVFKKPNLEAEVSLDSFSLIISCSSEIKTSYTLNRYGADFVCEEKVEQICGNSDLYSIKFDLEIDMKIENPVLKKFKSCNGLTLRELAELCPLEEIFCTLSAMKKQRQLFYWEK